MNSLVAKLLFGSGGLRSYEKDCIEQFLGLLDKDTAQTVRAQLKSFDVVQRSMKDKLVALCVFEDKPGRPRVPNESNQVIAARIYLRDSTETKVRCDVVFEIGFLSSLEFDVPPKGLLLNRTYTFVQTILLDDLKSQPVVAPKADDRVTGPLLTRIALVSDVRDILEPATEDTVARAVSRMSTVVPSDYLELLQETDGFRWGDWEFLGTRTRRIVYPDADYTLVAETQNGDRGLAVKDNQTVSRVYQYDAVEGDFSEVSSSFMEALLGSTRGEDTNVRREN